MSCDRLSDGASLGNTRHERMTRDPIVAHANQLWLALWRGRQQLIDGGVADEHAHPAIEGARGTAALQVAQDCHSHILAQSLGQHHAHMLAADKAAIAIARALGNHHNAIAAAGNPAGSQHRTHRGFPVVGIGRALRNQHPVGPAGQRAHQGQIPTVAAHHFRRQRCAGGSLRCC